MEQPPPQRVEIVIPVRTMVAVLAFAVLVALAILSLGTLLSIFLAAVVALGLDPVVSSLVRRGWGRGRAAVVVFFAVGVAVVVLVLLAVGPVWDQVVEFVENLPVYWEKISSSDAFEALLSSGSESDVKEFLADLASGLPDAAGAVLGVAAGAVGSVLSLVTLAFLALFLMMERPTITDWMFGFTPPSTEKRWRPILEDSIQAVSSTLIGNLAVSLVAALVAGLSAWALGLPFPVVLALITGLLDLIPQVGATVAGIILTLVALTVSTEAAVIMAVIQLIYQQIENYVVYPIVYRQAVELSGFTTIVAVLIASALLGVVGAILAVPFAAVIKVVLREASAPRRARMEALRGHEVAA